MRVLIFVLLATCLLLADAKGNKKNKKNEHEKNNKARAGARDSKGERVWHLAESEEECGDYSELYQSNEKPYDLCSEVNVTMNICSTRDTDKVMPSEMVEEDEETAAAEPRHEGHDHDEEDHKHKMYAPREDAEWEFKTGTCVFRLHMEKEESDEESSEAGGRKNNKKKGAKKNKKMTKSEMKRMQERSKLRKKLKEKKDHPEKRSRSKTKVHKNKKQIAAEPRTEA